MLSCCIVILTLDANHATLHRRNNFGGDAVYVLLVSVVMSAGRTVSRFGLIARLAYLPTSVTVLVFFPIWDSFRP